MSASWHEFTGWKCQSCGTENIIVERAAGEVDEATVFDRSCAACGATAPGTTIRPRGTAYRITTARAFYSDLPR